jgi:PAS domain S-box-containing protein
MSAPPQVPHDPARVTRVLNTDAARIGAELMRLDGGTDPFAASVRATRMPMVVSDPRQPDNPIVFVNDSFCRLTGYPREQIVGRNCRFLQGPDTDPATVARIRAAVQAQEPIEIDIRNHRRDGTPFWNRLLMAPVRDQTGEVAYFIASQVDVTLEWERLEGLEFRNAALLAELSDQLHAQEESEARLRYATQAAGMGVWELDLPGYSLTTDSTSRAIHGRDPALRFSYADRQACIHPDDMARVDEATTRAVETGAEYAIEYRVLRPGGTGWVEARAQVVPPTVGAPLRLAGVFMDVTERREATLRLQLSEASLRLATDAAEVGTWDLDLDADVLTWTDRTKAMFGLEPDEPCGMADFYTGLHPDDRAAVTAAFAAALDPARRTSYDVEYRTLGKHDGALRWVAARGRGMFQDGRCVRALGTALDITAQKAERARQDLLLALSGTTRTLADPTAILAAAATMLGRHLGVQRVGWSHVQAEADLMFVETGYADGLPPLHGPFQMDRYGKANLERRLAGQTLSVPDAGVPDQADANWAPLGIGAVISVPLMRDGTLRAALFVNAAAPRAWTPDEVRLVEDVAALVWDAVERARAEANLRELNATLEARVEERTAELRRAEDALRQSQKMEAVGQLTGGIAHDFNNLLTGITGALELLQRRVGEGRYGEIGRFASVATTSANRAAALTQRLLAFARRQPLDPKPVAANRLVADMEDLLRRTLGPGVTLEMVLSGGLWGTLCDPNQLESALLNLAINARDAMPEGGRLTIETANAHLDDAYARTQGFEVRSGQYVSISVTDTGVGMDPAVASRIFEPFFTTKPIGQGTGLGLSMLYGFVKQSDGHVRVYSEPGRGTTMRLYLPRHAGAAVLDGEMNAPATPAGAGETVLVVDDEDAVRMLVAEALADMGYVALEAANGSAGLDILRSVAKVDLLVTDVGLPGLNGRQLADAARVLRPGLRVLFITGYAGNAAIGNGVLEAGMEILTKPFALEALAAKLRAMMQR